MGKVEGNQASTGDLRIVAWLFALLLLVYVATAKGLLEYGDDVSMLQVTQSMVLRQRFDVPPGTPGAVVGDDGRWYSKYGLGQSIFAVPLFVVGQVTALLVPGDTLVDAHGFARAGVVIYVVSLLGIVVTAATGSLLYLTCRSIGFSAVGSLVAALGFGLGTFAWHYARTFMSEPLSAFTLLAAFYSLHQFFRGNDDRWLLKSGSASAACLLMRTSNALLLVPFLAWILWETYFLKRRGVFQTVRRVSIWALPILTATTMIAAYNFWRFGNPLETGYRAEAYAFTTPIYVGLFGLLLSPGKGVFWFAPIVLFGVTGWFDLRRTSACAATVVACVIAVLLFFYARYYQWYGGGVWGPRFLVTILPFCLIGVAATADRCSSVAGRVGLAAVAMVSFAVQVVSVLVPYVPYEAKMEAAPELFDDLLWNPSYSPIIQEMQDLLHHHYPLDIAPTYYSSPALAWMQLCALAAAFLILVLGGRWQLLVALPRAPQ